MVMAAALAFGSAACGDDEDPIRFSHLEYSGASFVEGHPAELEPREIALEEGIAVSAYVVAKDNRGRAMHPLDLSSSDPNIMGVEPGAEAGYFVFYGAQVGDTDVEVLIGEQVRGQVAARVVPQQAR